MLNTVKCYEALSKQYDKMLAERNRLIDVIDWQRKKIERLEDVNKYLIDDNERFKRRHNMITDRNIELCEENKNKDNFLSEISQHIGCKPESSTYKAFRRKLDELEIKGDK
ncbi:MULTISPECIES: hypothetical protein [Staphylococcus]|uniref:Uncharacterized protein n=1 Tax=Staphylococcus equorum TaxID=246432 RepID=A0A9X4L8Y4_9STAP|nr:MULTISPECIES: hypothetical protein [Staphylococcus]KRG09875.1 hypothetical protein ACA31_03075 [Staphylococcus sp. NAM3COL9]MDG0843385.1 hypothetical protein [Staphylococcus equorum]MDG0858696.1 hypothetical protein [Staphylococcus equorum]